MGEKDLPLDKVRDKRDLYLQLKDLLVNLLEDLLEDLVEDLLKDLLEDLLEDLVEDKLKDPHFVSLLEKQALVDAETKFVYIYQSIYRKYYKLLRL